MNYENQRVLIIAPHQDDETCGCGGIVQKFIQNKSVVKVIFGTFVDGVYKKFNKIKDTYEEYSGKKRYIETINACKLLGIEMDECPLFDNSFHHRLDTIPISERIDIIEKRIKNFNPTILFIPAVNNNQDHESINRAMMGVIRPQFFNGTVIEYEISNEINFKPNLYIDLTEKEILTKINAFNMYETQNSGNLHETSEEGIYIKSKYRGKQVYKVFSESFNIIRFTM